MNDSRMAEKSKQKKSNFQFQAHPLIPGRGREVKDAIKDKTDGPDDLLPILAII
jgi:hypothetical protein